jgi:aspartate racemase
VNPATLGIVGGLGPESTIDYYRRLLARHRERSGAAANLHIIIDSVDIARFFNFMAIGDLEGLTGYLAASVERLAHAGAELALVAANTPHVVFPQLATRSPIPLVSIVEATCARAASLRLERVSIFGTRFTMEGTFYPDALRAAGITVVRPEEQEMAWIHQIYVGELVPGVFLPETRARLLEIVDGLLHRNGIDGVILGGTELPLLLREPSHGEVLLLDTTTIHVDAALDRMLGPTA